MNSEISSYVGPQLLLLAFMMEESSECIGPKLAPFNPTGDDAIRVAIEMLEVTKVVRCCCCCAALLRP